MGTRRQRAGTTLFEILIAVSFLTLCAYTILETVLTADVQSTYALRRTMVMSALQDQLELARGSAAKGALVSGTTSTTLVLPGFVGPLSVSCTTSLESKSRRLFDVTASGSWSEETSLRSYTDSATLSTVVLQ